MAKKSNLATVLKADLATNIPLKMLAEMVRSQGRGRDTVLAHITPREAAKLKREGGSGTTNPVTGLPEFEDFGGGDFAGAGGADYATYAPGTEPGAAGTALPPEMVSATPAGQSWAATTAQSPGAYSGTDFAISRAYDPYGGYTLPAFSAPYAGDQTAAAGAAAPAFATIAAQPSERAVSPEQAFGAPTPQAAALQPPTTTPEKPGFLETALGKIDPLRALIAAGGLGFGLYNQAQARKQAADLQAQYQAAADQQKAFAEAQRTLAQPLLTQGAQMVGLSAQGALTAARQQQFDAYRARIAQEASRLGAGGAVVAAQAGAVEERARQDMLQAQQTAGLQLFGTGTAEYNTSVAQLNNALQTELQGLNANVALSQQANQAATGFYTNLAQFMVGGSMGGKSITIPVG